jgi:hypothetical protein
MPSAAMAGNSKGARKQVHNVNCASLEYSPAEFCVQIDLRAKPIVTIGTGVLTASEWKPALAP